MLLCFQFTFRRLPSFFEYAEDLLDEMDEKVRDRNEHTGSSAMSSVVGVTHRATESVGRGGLAAAVAVVLDFALEIVRNLFNRRPAPQAE